MCGGVECELRRGVLNWLPNRRNDQWGDGALVSFLLGGLSCFSVAAVIQSNGRNMVSATAENGISTIETNRSEGSAKFCISF
jgi:hypothetical protein